MGDSGDPLGPDHAGHFRPATSPAEAVQRIYSLTGRSPSSTRGEKRALLALRDALELDVETVRTNTVLGNLIAEELGVPWDPSTHTLRNTLTLAGLNALLEGASRARHAGSLKRLKDEIPVELSGPGWSEFQPARSKIEAVTRIAALTNAPREWLGPGGKEHKSVLINLADRLLPEAELNRSTKTKLAASIASELDVPWNDSCHSTGETISLKGLNMILAGAERRTGRLGRTVADALLTPEAEGDALAAALFANLHAHWDGRECVTWLARQGLRGAYDNEWQGFYGEERAKLILNTVFTPPTTPRRTRYGNTVFDYSLNFVWDIKVHTARQITSSGVHRARGGAMLNAELATREAVDDQGIGFLILSGTALMDTQGEFVSWHRAFKEVHTGRKPAPSNSGKSRVRKAAFDLTGVESFWVPNLLALDSAILKGALSVRPIGRQPPRIAGGEGLPRKDKFMMHMGHARSSIRVAHYEWRPNE